MAATPTIKDETRGAETRQLLDELDALMDRMLALPIEEADQLTPETAPAAAPVTVSATLTLLESSPTVLETSPAAPSDLIESPVDYKVDATADPPLPVEQPIAVGNSDEPVLLPVISEVAAPTPIELAAPMEFESRWRPEQISYQFLLWLNQGFDRGTTRLGLLGRLLRSRPGRTLIGIAGLGLLALALAWIGKDWLGWNWQGQILE